MARVILTAVLWQGALTLEATDDDKPIPVQEQRPVIEEDYKDPPTPGIYFCHWIKNKIDGF